MQKNLTGLAKALDEVLEYLGEDGYETQLLRVCMSTGKIIHGPVIYCENHGVCILTEDDDDPQEKWCLMEHIVWYEWI